MNKQNKTTNIKIIEINCNSLVSHAKRHAMDKFLQIHKPDIVLVCETKLNPRHNVYFKKYNFIRNDKDVIGTTGTGILVRQEIKYRQLDYSNLQLNTLECTAALIQTEYVHLTIVSAYRRNINPTELGNDIKKIIVASNQQSNSAVVIGGDLNARHSEWYNTHNNSAGVCLQDWFEINGHDYNVSLQFSLHPTFYRSNYSSLIDLFIVSNDLNIIYNNSLGEHLQILDYESDHRAVELIIAPKGKLEKSEEKTTLAYHRTDWQEFRRNLNAGLNTLNIPENKNMDAQEIDEACQSFTEHILTAVEKSVPLITLKHNSQLKLPHDLELLIKKKCQMRRCWQRKHYDHSEHQLKSYINNITKIIKDRIKQVYEQHWNNTLRNVKMDNHTFNHINKLAGRNKRTGVANIRDPISNISVSSDSAKAEILAVHYAQVHSSNLLLGSASTTNEINHNIHSTFNRQIKPNFEYNQFQTANPSFVYSSDRHLVSISELKEIIRSRANKKSCGNDKISNFVVKKLSKCAIIKLATLLNQSYNIGHFPTSWKTAIVIAVNKKGKPPDDVKSYRPISLLSCLAKVYECAIKKIIVQHCDDNHILPDDQFGFRQGRTTTQALIKLKTDVALQLSQRTPVIACSLDNERAFDTVWIEGLIYKMANFFQFSPHICHLIYNYLSDRKFFVNVNQNYSGTYRINAGVPQGGVLSAIIYSIYISDIPKPDETDRRISRLQYADDMLIYMAAKNLSNAQTKLNKYLEEITNFNLKWKIKTNPAKSEVMVFKGVNSNHSKRINRQSKNIALRIQGQQIPLVNTMKYLGVIFSKNATHFRHVDHIHRKASQAFQIIRPILRKTECLSTNIKLLCYKQLIRPILTYGFPAWSSISSAQMERLRKLERKCIRVCLHMWRKPNSSHRVNNSTLYYTAGIDRIDKYMVYNTLKFFDKLQNDSPEIIADCLNISTDLLERDRYSITAPWTIISKVQNGGLFNNGNIIYYHRRSQNRNNLQSMVYNIKQ